MGGGWLPALGGRGGARPGGSHGRAGAVRGLRDNTSDDIFDHMTDERTVRRIGAYDVRVNLDWIAVYLPGYAQSGAPIFDLPCREFYFQVDYLRRQLIRHPRITHHQVIPRGTDRTQWMFLSPAGELCLRTVGNAPPRAQDVVFEADDVAEILAITEQRLAADA